MTLLLLLACTPDGTGDTADTAVDHWSYVRAYEADRTWSFEISTTHSTDGVEDHTKVARSSHRVLEDASAEEVSWTTQTVHWPAGGTDDETAAAESVPPYTLSLLEGGSLELPELTVPELRAMITDQLTFYVAISPHVGAPEVDTAGTSHALPEAVIGEWSDGEEIPLGQDCILPTVTLVELDLDAGRAVYETAFEPPDEVCLDYAAEAFAEPVVDGQPNNFQQTTDQGSTDSAIFGLEAFTVVAEVDTADGLLRAATMENRLDLHVLAGCDADWEGCAYESELLIERALTLERVVE